MRLTKPAEEGDVFERALRSDAAVLREESAKDENIEFTIPHKKRDQHSGSHLGGYRSPTVIRGRGGGEIKKRKKKENRESPRLMVRHKHCRPRLQPLLILNLKLNPNQRTRDILESPRRRPLRNAHFPYSPQRDARHDAVRGAREH